MLNIGGIDADEEWKLGVVAKHVHLRRDLDTVPVSQRLQQSPRAAHGDFNGPGVIDQRKGRRSTGAAQLLMTGSRQMNNALKSDQF